MAQRRRRLAIGAAMALTLTPTAGCGRDDDARTVRAVAETFATAVQQHDGVRACAQLSSDTRKALEQQASKPCREAVTELHISGQHARSAEVYVTDAVVQLDDDDTVFLDDTNEAWRVAAAGCTPRGPAEPADCEVQA